MERKTKQWCEYPIGTKAISVTGFSWVKTKRGWKANGGSTFPTPAGDALYIELLENKSN